MDGGRVGHADSSSVTVGRWGEGAVYAGPVPSWKSGWRKARKPHREALYIYFANITAWNAKAEAFVDQAVDKFDVFAFAEHHLRRPRLAAARRGLGRLGLSSAAVPAREGPKGGTMSGVMMAVSKNLWPQAPARPSISVPVGSWTAISAKLSGCDITLVTVYFRPGEAEEDTAIMLKPQQLMRATAVAKPRAGMGFDGWIPAMWRQTSDEVVVALTGLLRSVEAKLR